VHVRHRVVEPRELSCSARCHVEREAFVARDPAEPRAPVPHVGVEVDVRHGEALFQRVAARDRSLGNDGRVDAGVAARLERRLRDLDPATQLCPHDGEQVPSCSHVEGPRSVKGES
jgi:hypothetical protein